MEQDPGERITHGVGIGLKSRLDSAEIHGAERERVPLGTWNWSA